MKKDKKKRRFSLVFILLLIGSLIINRNILKYVAVDLINIIDKKDSFMNKEKEELNRYTYQDGFYEEKLSSNLKDKILGVSFPVEFSDKYTKISFDDLRYVRLKYKDLNGITHDDGEMIVNKKVAKEVLFIFYELYINDYPIEKIKLVEEYNANDEESMEDNNTSCFNYRVVEGEDKLSWHALGLAIDINPKYNPYIVGKKVYPVNGYDYVNRKNDFIYKIDYDDLAYKIFKKYGWSWGGDFKYTKDYQHFYKVIYEDNVRESKE